jgi:cytochrome P450
VEPLRYFGQCFYESLRIETPTVTSGAVFTEDQTLLGYQIRKGDLFVINMQQIHNDKTEWKDPDEFIPERFDSTSPYYLRPDGQKRLPFSFAPFLGGKRICLGKTFAEVVAKFVVPAMLCRLQFDIAEESLKNGPFKKPKLNLDIDDDPVVMMSVKRVNLNAVGLPH